ncbi:DUF72 domain-containing protein [candidate division KSB1 bacterium]|nr:DUF72 domain-containing protein [candidate division KSB1 bacterium]
MEHEYYIGPAGWSYRDWEGIVYPTTAKKSFNELKYISHYFDTVEINSSFYRPPSAQTTKKWLESVSDNKCFSFTYKLWNRYTHHRDDFPGQEEETIVKHGIEPLLKNNKLGAMLIQFPWSFKMTSENLKWLGKVLSTFVDYLPIVEIRHSSWQNQDFFDFLKEHQAGYANIDQPVIGESVVISQVTPGDVAYIRFHGRNESNWFSESSDAASRYDYLYNSSELSELLKSISILIENSPKTYIIFNNHSRGQAVVNALQTSFLLAEEKVYVPQPLESYYSELKSISKGDIQPAQISLF